MLMLMRGLLSDLERSKERCEPMCSSLINAHVWGGGENVLKVLQKYMQVSKSATWFQVVFLTNRYNLHGRADSRAYVQICMHTLCPHISSAC